MKSPSGTYIIFIPSLSAVWVDPIPSASVGVAAAIVAVGKIGTGVGGVVGIGVRVDGMGIAVAGRGVEAGVLAEPRHPHTIRKTGRVNHMVFL